MTKNKSTTKRAQQRFVKEKKKSLVVKAAKHSMISYVKNRPVAVKEDSLNLGLNDVVEFPVCNGIGNCCSKMVFIEPTDVFRILTNPYIRARYSISNTSDLYNGENSLLISGFDEKLNLPLAVIRQIDKACPFLEDGNCLLGDDRPTQCKSKPIGRYGIFENGKLYKWEFKLYNDPCASCSKVGFDRNRYVIRTWLSSCSMQNRYAESDLFLTILNYLKGTKIEILKTVGAYLFNWHDVVCKLFDKTMEESLLMCPNRVEDIFISARSLADVFVRQEKEENNED